ncbi:hypothetical protein RB594_004097 [Gaeumannomyces avenae]
MHLANNDVVKAVVASVLLGQALAAPMPSVYGGEGAVLDTRNIEVLDARGLDALEARDPKRGGFLKGFTKGLDIWNSISGGGNNNNQKRDEIAEAPEYEESAEESADIEARDLELMARDPKRGGFLKGFTKGLDIWNSISGSGNNNNQKRGEIAELDVRDLHMIIARDIELIARDPKGRGLLKGFTKGLDLLGSIRGGGDNNYHKRDESDLHMILARDIELLARDPKGRGLVKGFTKGLGIWNSLRGGGDNNNQKRDAYDEAAAIEEAAQEAADEDAQLDAREMPMVIARDLELMARDPKGRFGLLKGLKFIPDAWSKITGGGGDNN